MDSDADPAASTPTRDLPLPGDLPEVSLSEHADHGMPPAWANDISQAQTHSPSCSPSPASAPSPPVSTLQSLPTVATSRELSPAWRHLRSRIPNLVLLVMTRKTAFQRLTTRPLKAACCPLGLTTKSLVKCNPNSGLVMKLLWIKKGRRLLQNGDLNVDGFRFESL
jgi:hypothetical protein